MLQVYSNDLSRLSLYAQGDEIATVMWKDKWPNWERVFSYSLDQKQYIIDINNPVLVTDYSIMYAIPYYLTRETVFMLYSKPIRVTEYDWYNMYFEQRNYLGVWWPSIDTIFFCRALRTYDLSSVKTIAEIGSGPWFIARYLWHKNPHIQHIYFNDINPKAQQYYNDFKPEWYQSSFVLWDWTKFLEQQKVDMVVCNPPYIPRPQSIDDNPYEWLSLVQWLISHMWEYLTPGGKLFLNISSLARKQFDLFVSTAWVKVKLLDTMHVPLKVFTVLHNADRMHYLKEECGLEDAFHDWHQRWHTLELYEISI